MNNERSTLGLLLHAMLLLHIMAFSCQVVVRTGVQSDRQVTNNWVGSQKNTLEQLTHQASLSQMPP